MNPPRDIVEVIDALLAVIPESESEMRLSFKGVSKRAGYIAPEVMHMAWTEGTALLNRFIPTPPSIIPLWQQQVVNIWTDRA